MTTINPYLYFNGNCEEAFDFYKNVFQRDFTFLGRYKDVPQADRQMFQETDEKIMHVSLPISNETVLMGSDNSEAHNQMIINSNFSLIVHTDKKEEADRLFNELSKGGLIKMSMNLTFWGSYYGICVDKFEVMWKVTVEAEH